MKILVVNVGSTSLKFKLFSFPGETYSPEDMVAEGKIEGISQPESPFKFNSREGKTNQGTGSFKDYGEGIRAIIAFLTDPDSGILESLDELTAVAFKTVHCGYIPEGAALLDTPVLDKMEDYSMVAPAHNPPYIRAIRTFQTLLPSKPMIGLFEPSFHFAKSPEAVYYGLPIEVQEEYGIQRYGFHGASFRYISERVPSLLQSSTEELRLVACHLGGSSSICAIKNGVSIDTSMGFSPQSGIIHSTRPDDIDPFAVLFLMKKREWSVDDAVSFLCSECGVKGVSGLNTGEFKSIEQEARKGHERANLAVDMFVYGIIKYIGSYTVALGGMDALVFTGGIGEYSPYLRERVCQRLECLGIRLDPAQNNTTLGEENIISGRDSNVTVLVVPTNEEFIVARESALFLQRA